MADPCTHQDFTAEVDVIRLLKPDSANVTGYMADIRIVCTQCSLPFEFLGLPAGYNPQGACVSIDGLEARIGLSPQGMMPSPLAGIAAHFKPERVN